MGFSTGGKKMVFNLKEEETNLNRDGKEWKSILYQNSGDIKSWVQVMSSPSWWSVASPRKETQQSICVNICSLRHGNHKHLEEVTSKSLLYCEMYSYLAPYAAFPFQQDILRDLH